MRHSLLVFMLLLSVYARGQQTPVIETTSGTSMHTFSEVQASINQYYKENPGEKGEKVWRRKEWFLEPRLYPSGEFQNIAMKSIKAQYAYLSQPANSRVTHAHWSHMGPLNVQGGVGIGRINTFLIHPSNANIIYIGASNGGIWKSTNGGTTWSDISPNLPLLAINDLGFDPNNANTIYALTGDGDAGWPGDIHIPGGVLSIGIIKSTDAGSSWHPTDFSFAYPGTIVPTKLLINPYSADTQFVATKTGLYKTHDNWASYTQVLSGFGTVYDVEYHPEDTRILYCSGKNWVQKSTSKGNQYTWAFVDDPDFDIIDAQAERIELAVTPDLPSAVYAMVGGNKFNPTIALFKSLLSGNNNSWTIQDSVTELLDAQTWYNLSIAVKDTDHSDVFVAGVWARRSSTSGTSWTQITDGGTTHADVHDIQYHDDVLYLATDGGLHKSTDDGNTWIDLWSGLGITEVYRISGTPQNSNLNYCGNQDNGIMESEGTSLFTHRFGGDGMATCINYQNSDTVYWCLNYGDCNRTLDSWQTWNGMKVPSGPHDWVAPMIIDPVNPAILFVARDSIYRSDNAGDTSTWKYLGQPFSTSANCLQQGVNNRNRLYASSRRYIFRTDNALADPGPASWTDISNGLPDRFISGIAVDPTNANEVYICFSGYLEGEKVYRSTNGGSGASWVNISGSLPNVPVNCLAFHNNGINSLYAGTDIGVFYIDDNLDDWIYYSNNLPTVVVNDMYINTTGGKLIAGTYGRGMWQTNLYNGCDVFLILGAGNIGGHRHYSVSDWITSAHDYNPDMGTNIHYSAGSYIDLTTGFEVSGLGFFEGKIGPCPPVYEEPLTESAQQGRPFIFSEEVLRRLQRED